MTLKKLEEELKKIKERLKKIEKMLEEKNKQDYEFYSDKWGGTD
tara:strand:+ start:178 stop:309 length:132 start_codon:yes stop_codon:yes gene_type:complete